MVTKHTPKSKAPKTLAPKNTPAVKGGSLNFTKVEYEYR